MRESIKAPAEKSVVNMVTEMVAGAYPTKSKKGLRIREFARFMDCKDTNSFNDVVIDFAVRHVSTRTKFEDRLFARECELCGKTDTALEIHHVNKVKNLKGKNFWEMMT